MPTAGRSAPPTVENVRQVKRRGFGFEVVEPVLERLGRFGSLVSREADDPADRRLGDPGGGGEGERLPFDSGHGGIGEDPGFHRRAVEAEGFRRGDDGVCGPRPESAEQIGVFGEDWGLIPTGQEGAEVGQGERVPPASSANGEVGGRLDVSGDQGQRVAKCVGGEVGGGPDSILDRQSWATDRGFAEEFGG